jgi:hypothetical protein
MCIQSGRRSYHSYSFLTFHYPHLFYRLTVGCTDIRTAFSENMVGPKRDRSPTQQGCGRQGNHLPMVRSLIFSFRVIPY